MVPMVEKYEFGETVDKLKEAEVSGVAFANAIFQKGSQRKCEGS